MSLIKSISGIRGTIGGPTGDTLNPFDIVKFTTAYAMFLQQSVPSGHRLHVVVGRDARLSGEMVRSVVCGTLIGMGIDVTDIGPATTPTTELAVIQSHADGGIIITASHNPRHWNALKLLNSKGEFLSKEDGNVVLAFAEAEQFSYADVDSLGQYRCDTTFDRRHIEAVLELPLVDVDAIRNAHFRVCADTINSVGGIILPQLFEKLGVEYTLLNGTPDGNFAHNPEPLEKNLTGIMDAMRSGNYDLGIVVDPDVDRLAFICEDGTMFGEEYTLVSVADYVLEHTPGNTVSNLSSTRALRDVTLRRGGSYSPAAVGEVNVVEMMKATQAVIGGEGNGGVIYPACHNGRDALVGIGLFLSLLAHRRCTVSQLKATMPIYYMAKGRVELTPDTDVDAILDTVKSRFADEKVNTVDGVKIDFADRWVHLRKSNTEPIIRIYTEAPTQQEADALCDDIRHIIDTL